MLDLRGVLQDLDGSEARLRTRSPELSLDRVRGLAEARRRSSQRFADLRHSQKQRSEIFATKGAAPEDIARARAELKEVSAEVKRLEDELKEIEAQLEAEMLLLPNLPDPETPVGRTAEDNLVIRTWGEPRRHAFEAHTHDEIGSALGILDFEAAARVSGARFAVYRGLGAHLERALACFMLDLHVERHGHTEILPPFLVSRESMTGTGQLPKFEEEAFKTKDEDLFLIPTAEVPVTNLHRGEILDADRLPIRYVAYSACFRREAGSYGKETRGLTRLHQFQKVELVHLTRPEDSGAAHEALTRAAEAVLQALGLPYRVVALCTGDLGFGAAKCYDLEVWLAGQGAWREISSCSNFRDFQARRANIRYRPAAGEKPRHVHTLNGSGLAIGRTVVALLEHYQESDGTVVVPEALRPYMRGCARIVGR
jgi:seryl-tRNA synthetase